MHYLGTLYGKAVASLALLLSAGHTAVWLGASTPDARNWVQAGLEGDHPYAYVERGHAGQQVSLRTWPVAPGTTAHVRVLRDGNRYRVLISYGTVRYKSVWVRLRHAVKITTLETTGPAEALINEHLVTGP